MKRFNITKDIENRASLGQLTSEERQQMRDEIQDYRKYLMNPRKRTIDLLLLNSKQKNKKIE